MFWIPIEDFFYCCHLKSGMIMIILFERSSKALNKDEKEKQFLVQVVEINS